MKSSYKLLLLLQPILIALFPVTHLCANNIPAISKLHCAFAIITITAFILFFVLLFSLIYRDYLKGLVATNYLVISSYGLKLFMESVRNHLEHNLLIFRGTVIAATTLLVLFTLYFFYKLTKKTITKTFFLQVAVLPFLFFNALFVYQFMHRKARMQANYPQYQKETKNLERELVKQIPKTKQETAYLPDIYFIIFDAYTDNDTLKKIFHFDNNNFLKKLEQLGFYVAHEAKSNYPCTIYSLTATLNMKHLTKKATTIEHHIFNRDNMVKNFLEQLGYTYFDVSIYANDALSLFYDDNYFVMKQKRDSLFGEYKRFLFGQHGFAKIFLESRTPIYPALRPLYTKIRPDTELRKFDLLKQIPSLINKPKFVYLHIYVPHAPYAFDENGGWYPRRRSNQPKLAYEKDAYLNAIKFLNKKIYPALKHIIETSSKPPVILLQGDHGSRFTYNDRPWDSSQRDSYSILSTWYLPRGGDRLLHPSVSPINNFRIVFNHYFGTKLPLLPDAQQTKLVKQSTIDTVNNMFTTNQGRW